MNKCLFCSIARGKGTTKLLAKTDLVAAFNDINPKAPVHILIIPQRHVNSPNQLSEAELKAIIDTAAQLVDKNNLQSDGYRLVFNVGRFAGQEIEHAHLHLLGGSKLTTSLA